MERRQNEGAQALLRRAIAMEPGYARAHALLGWAAWWATLHLWAVERASAYRQAAGHAQNALALDPSAPWARLVSGLCLSTAGPRPAERRVGKECVSRVRTRWSADN